MPRLTIGLVALGLTAFFAPSARAQGVAFQPVVGSFPQGAMMSVTPVVSYDRRYVRLSVNPMFTGLEGFDNFQVPAAVSGGPGGALPGGFAGLNGPMGGMGLPAGAAAPAAAVPGGTSSSDPFQAALARFDGGPRAAQAPPPRQDAAPKKSIRRRGLKTRK